MRTSEGRFFFLRVGEKKMGVEGCREKKEDFGARLEEQKEKYKLKKWRESFLEKMGGGGSSKKGKPARSRERRREGKKLGQSPTNFG